jgi:hypothetical protein
MSCPTICRIDSMTPHVGHRARFRRFIVSRATATSTCGASARASADPLDANPRFDDVSSGILPYEGGIERTTATIPEATNKPRQIPTIQVGKYAGRAICVRISIPFVVRPGAILAPSPIGNPSGTEKHIVGLQTKCERSMVLTCNDVGAAAHTLPRCGNFCGNRGPLRDEQDARLRTAIPANGRLTGRKASPLSPTRALSHH